MLAVQKYECQPVWIPLIRLSVRQRVTHPLAYGLLSRNSSTHTHTHTDIADCHSRHESSRSGGQFRFVSIVCLDIGSRSCQPEDCRDISGVSVSVGFI